MVACFQKAEKYERDAVPQAPEPTIPHHTFGTYNIATGPYERQPPVTGRSIGQETVDKRLEKARDKIELDFEEDFHTEPHAKVATGPKVLDHRLKLEWWRCGGDGRVPSVACATSTPRPLNGVPQDDHLGYQKQDRYHEC